MTNSHTPGPWYRNINAKYPVFAGGAPNHVYIASISILHGAPESEREANMRLIAAAPELLDALQDLMESADLNRENLESKTIGAMAKARVAIARAKGIA